MTTEVEWRRKWKPGLSASPWQPIQVDKMSYLIKYSFTQDSYEVLITDFHNYWFEELADTALKKRVKKLNPGIEAPLTRILDQIKSVLDKTQENATSTSLKVSVMEDPDVDNMTRVMLTMNSHLAGMPFSWKFQCKTADKTQMSEHMTLPLLAMVGELTRRQQELVKIIHSKDKEIEDYKSQGVKASRKHIMTPNFVETAFEMNMMTSKDFETCVRDFQTRSFCSTNQDLYRQIMSKQAWMGRAPSKAVAADDDDLLADMSGDVDGRSATGQSWGNSRLPPSLQPSKSPTKSPNKTPSPPKSSNSSTPEASPAKDSELLRRQALERRLEMEGSKKMEKTKKKKKIGF